MARNWRIDDAIEDIIYDRQLLRFFTEFVDRYDVALEICQHISKQIKRKVQGLIELKRQYPNDEEK